MSGAKYKVKRTEAADDIIEVQAGFRSGVLEYRVRGTDGQVIGGLTFDQLYDLADAIDRVLDEQERDPLALIGHQR